MDIEWIEVLAVRATPPPPANAFEILMSPSLTAQQDEKKKTVRELCKQGWTPKPPTGLSDDHRYVRPGRSVRGKDGVDYFTGEKALMAFARQCGWLYYGVTAGTKPPTAASPAASGALPAVPPTAANLIAATLAAAKPTVAPLTNAQPTVTTPPGTASTGMTPAAAKPTAAPPTTAMPSISVAPATAQRPAPRMPVGPATAHTSGPPTEQASPTSAVTATAQDLTQSMAVVAATAQISEPPRPVAPATAEQPVVSTVVMAATALQEPVLRYPRHGTRQWVHYPQVSDKGKRKPVHTHADYLAKLHVELLAQQKGDFQGNIQAQNLLSAPAAGLPHVLTKTTETYKNKARQYLCKVCSAYSEKQHRRFKTPYYCEECTHTFGGRVSLCNKVRPEDSGNTDTWHQTWHVTWKNGTITPPDMRKKIRFRKRKIEEVAEDEEEE